MQETRFWFDPDEPVAEHENRWDEFVREQWCRGFELLGLGPDNDWPIRYEDEQGRELPPFDGGSHFEVYELVSREESLDGRYAETHAGR